MGLLLGKISEVQTSSGKEVLGLTNVHPVTLQIERMQLSIRGHLGKYFFFDGSWAQRDSFEDIGVEDVDSSVDAIRNKLDWFFDEAFNL